jgi:hypothetical protein
VTHQRLEVAHLHAELLVTALEGVDAGDQGLDQVVDVELGCLVHPAENIN